MTKILAMCSSHRRPAMLDRMMKSWKETIGGQCSRLVVYVDEKNPMLEAYKALVPPKGASLEYGPYKTMVQVLNYFSCEKYRDFSHYLECNDDHVFVTKSWDIKMSDAIDRKNMGIAIAYGITQNMPTSTMHGAALIRELGYFFPPEYKHSYVDCWLTSIGFKTNILTHLPDVLIDHRHPAFGKAPKDETYIAVEADYNDGRMVFEKWQKEQMDTDINRIMSLIDRVRTLGRRSLPRIEEPLSAMLITYQRIDLLERMVRSYLKTDPRPRRLYVFDDCSPDLVKIKNLIMRIPEVVLIQDDEHEGCFRKTPKSLDAMFDAGASSILILDPDCVFANDWWKTAEILAERSDGLYGLFNAKVHPILSGPSDGLVEKDDIGGLGMIMPRDVWEKYIKPYRIAKDERTHWDGRLCRLWQGDGRKIFACSPSLIQHTGARNGTNPNPEIIAEDFIGESSFSDFEMAHPFKLRYLGEKPYRGFDDNGRVEINAKFMDFVQMSREKARQTLQDMPSMWVFIQSLTDESLW